MTRRAAVSPESSGKLLCQARRLSDGEVCTIPARLRVRDVFGREYAYCRPHAKVGRLLRDIQVLGDLYAAKGRNKGAP